MRPRSEFAPGDRVIVGGGYDMEPKWLEGKAGYAGTLVDIVGDRAVVELDEELVLSGKVEGWADFGAGQSAPVARVTVARGRWLALFGASAEHTWREPIGRLHVGLCAQKPDVDSIPQGGGAGVWVESHATMRHV